MLVQEECVEVHALKRRGGRSRLLPAIWEETEKQSGRICWVNGCPANVPGSGRIRSMGSRRMCVSGLLMIRMFGRRRCSTR